MSQARVMYPTFRRATGFTLVELLVVIGVIAVLIGMLMPALSRARQQALQVQCMSNLRQVGTSLQIYSNNWKGACYPPGLGAGPKPWLRWPMYVFKFGPLPDPPVDDVRIYTPKIMICPLDLQDDVADFYGTGDGHGEGHSYIINNHIHEKGLKFGSRLSNGLSPGEVVLMGEKRWNWPDYYMDSNDARSDYPTRVDPYKHGITRGSNYLFMDMHAGTMKIEQFAQLEAQLTDPWDPAPPTNIEGQ
ncbi:MAG TPA: type II secretion system protein [Tepidisphaeraceae bacterium]|jgi:prepilin-type N-terminal cleavage/methylation domain-containing protein|nr:type II secretion system protein [Tepidisphaeraceae bacterium]